MSILILGELTPSTASIFYTTCRVPAGFPSPAMDYSESRISLDELMDLRAPHVFLARAEGDSMTGAGIGDGDLLVIDRSREAEPGEIVIAAINGEPLVKILAQLQEGLGLMSANPCYPEILMQDGDELAIWGVVRWSIKSHQRHA